MFGIFRTAAEPAARLPEPPPPEAAAVPVAACEPLAQRLTLLVHRHGADSAELRPSLLAALRESLGEGRAEIKRRFLADGRGMACVHAQSRLMDETIRALADVIVRQVLPADRPTAADRFAVVAVGGYGRSELAPFSDIDLLFLLPPKHLPRVEASIELMLYLLWDLGLKLGHAVRSVDECIRSARQDRTISTNLLEARFLWGEQTLFNELERRYQRDIVRGNSHGFVETKLTERDERHQKLGDSRYVLEPNIKEGKGGLRDLQTLFWIGKFLYQVDGIGGLVKHNVLTRQEARRFSQAEGRLWAIRCHLHYLANRPEERLTFDVQKAIAERLGYTDREGALGVERFMKHYFLIAKEVGDLTRIFCAALEAESKRKPRRGLRFFFRGQKTIEGFRLDGARLTVADETQFQERPVDMIRLFHVAQRQDLDIHPNALKLITRSRALIRGLRKDPDANRLFMEILTSDKDPEHTLRRMSGAGVLGAFIQDFGRVVAQMQYDMYHVYTVDEHTLFAIGILHRIETGQAAQELPLATEVMCRVVSRRALYVALLLHDIAKGRGGDHSELGAKLARRLGPRLGLDPEETETAEWLVLHHLLMSQIAFKRDIDDEKTVRDFVKTVESPERLRLLLVLTTADIRAVGPGRWNNWRGTLLGNLYRRALSMMSGGFDADAREARVRAAQEAVRARLPDWPAEETERFLALGYPPYWLSFDPDTHAYHARMIRTAAGADPMLHVETRTDRSRNVTEVTILAEDHPGLFSELAGALSVSGANILEARIFTLTNGMALDVFVVQDAAIGGAFDAGEKRARLAVTVERCLAGTVHPMRELAKKRSAYPSRTRVFRVEPRVLIENEVSRTHTVIEVNGRDRPGLLYDVTRALTGLNLQISSAMISTYGLRAVDVFYVKDVFGLKVTHETKLAEIHDRLLKALVDPDCHPGPDTSGVVALTERRRQGKALPSAKQGARASGGDD